MAPKIPTSSEQGKVIVIDAHHPLYLQACDTPGSSLVSIQLTGSKTYFLWSRSMKIGLLVLSWIMMISVSRELLSGIVYASSALQVWNDLKERFDKCRSQIMMMDHTPSVNKAYSLVMAEECQRILGKANIAGSEASSNSMIPNSDLKNLRIIVTCIVTIVTGKGILELYALDFMVILLTREVREEPVLVLPLQPILPESTPLMIISWSTQTSLVKVALLPPQYQYPQQWQYLYPQPPHQYLRMPHLPAHENGKLASDCTMRTSEGKIHLPNGSLAKVDHIGFSQILGWIEITNVLHIPEFKYNLLSVPKLTKELNYCVIFYLDFCLFQDLSNGKVRGIGKLENDLYVLHVDCQLKSQGAPLTSTTNAVSVSKNDLYVLHVDCQLKSQGAPLTSTTNAISKGCMLLTLHTKEFIVSTDVVFKEDIFPFQDMSSSVPTLFPILQPLEVSDTYPLLVVLLHDIILHETDSTSSSDPPPMYSSSLPMRRSFRTTRPPIWMHDFHITQPKYGSLYPMSNHVCYDHLSSSYGTTLSSHSSISEPTSFAKASSHHQWVEAMKSEIAALEANHT
ncbi:hypothetical protein KY290_023696 [Solanum tuberosum]|uniref:Retrotransposon Copia-like N-terminal domain-containing protein n=1 Tax=Solanum tuberosum TaxID=4113 RepID=A0ABQ7V7Y6_SOLTU|nr:hypothetical protein KY285_021797 [Solanum tuberosum]KAH0760203.1 hypothetical protein KY290_023696 [Solanum tuberosum]